MRRLLPPLAVAALLLCAATAPAVTSAAQRTPCAVRGSVTIAANPVARVYVRKARGERRDLYGCLFKSGQTVKLATWVDRNGARGDQDAPQAWLRDGIVAVNRWTCPSSGTVDGCVGTTRTISLLTGERLRAANTGTYVSALVQGPLGAFAYVSRGGAVVKSDATGETVVLDAGPGIDAASLAVAGARVYWMRSGAPQSALLTP